jgi:hypothetical protein
VDPFEARGAKYSPYKQQEVIQLINSYMNASGTGP